MSQKPKCITCPFWENFTDPEKFDNGERAKSFCRRFPPVDDWFPEMRGNEWCGEHPSFAAWIASLGPKEKSQVYAVPHVMGRPHK